MNQILDAARVLLSLLFLSYASWSDWKNREVSNKVWLVFAPLAFVLTAVEYVFFAQQLLLLYVISFAVTSGIAVVLFYAGAFGGADAKALMCLALALPYYPIYLLSGASFLSPLFPIIVFSNAVILAALTVVYALLRNSLWRLRTGSSLFAGLEKESIWRNL